jgi:hypothetical protein
MSGFQALYLRNVDPDENTRYPYLIPFSRINTKRVEMSTIHPLSTFGMHIGHKACYFKKKEKVVIWRRGTRLILIVFGKSPKPYPSYHPLNSLTVYSS